MPALEPAGLRTCFFASSLYCWSKFPTSDLAHSLLHIEVQSYGQSGGSEMEALQEAYRQISSSAGECEDKRAEGSRTPLSLSTLQPASTVESGQTQLLANCCPSPSACLCFKPFDLLLFHRKCFQLCLKPKDVRFLALALFAAWVPLADSKQLDFVEDVTVTIFPWILKSSIGGLSPWSNMNRGGGGLNYCLWHFFLIPSHMFFSALFWQQIHVNLVKERTEVLFFL